MFEMISLVLKFIFVLVIYMFIFGIMRLIYLDIKSMNSSKGIKDSSDSYLKLLNRRESLDFRVEETYVLDKDATMGRADTNDFVIKDPFISGRHMRFYQRDGFHYIEDLNSKNGTYLNGSRIMSGEPMRLRDGDKISAGHVEFLFIEGKRQEVG